MTETPEPSPRPTSAVAAPAPAVERARPPKLYTAAAWVVIVAGIVFILSTVFFAGALILGHQNYCHSRYYHGTMYRPEGPGNGPWQYGGSGMFPPPGYGPGSGQTPTPTPSPAPSTPASRP